MNRILMFAILFFLTGSAAGAEETYDLIFRTGTLDDIPRERVLSYDRDVDLRDDEKRSQHQTGQIKLAFAPEEMARLDFVQGEKSRVVGSFPASVGNPLIMYFVETVIRDVSQHAGGSPFYIRNRIKAALLQKAPIVEETRNCAGRSVPVKSITLQPFLNDKNRSKMRGYEDLSLTIAMSPEVPGWYCSLVADTKPTANGAPVYTNALRLEPEAAKE